MISILRKYLIHRRGMRVFHSYQLIKRHIRNTSKEEVNNQKKLRINPKEAGIQSQLWNL